MISLKQKQWIDRGLGKLLCHILTPIARLTGILLRLDHTVDFLPRNGFYQFTRLCY